MQKAKTSFSQVTPTVKVKQLAAFIKILELEDSKENQRCFQRNN